MSLEKQMGSEASGWQPGGCWAAFPWAHPAQGRKKSGEPPPSGAFGSWEQQTRWAGWRAWVGAAGAAEKASRSSVAWALSALCGHHTGTQKEGFQWPPRLFPERRCVFIVTSACTAAPGLSCPPRPIPAQCPGQGGPNGHVLPQSLLPAGLWPLSHSDTVRTWSCASEPRLSARWGPLHSQGSQGPELGQAACAEAGERLQALAGVFPGRILKSCQTTCTL